MAQHFHPLRVARVSPEAAGAIVVTFAVSPELVAMFAFAPGQFLTLRTAIGGEEIRRNYSICSSRQRYDELHEVDIGIKPVEGGRFSHWAVRELREGVVVDVMPPDGRFTPHVADASHRVALVAGSGITPVLSIIASTLASEPESCFTLVYCNQKTGAIMFHEVLQDLKDQYPTRLSLVFVLSRQPQEVPLLQGRLDEAKVRELLRTLLPADRIDEAFLCGPEDMILGAERALRDAGLAPERIHAERFASPGAGRLQPAPPRDSSAAESPDARHELHVVLDGKTHHLRMGDEDKVLDAALEAGLDLPYSCRGGVCCTCRARVLEGEVRMDRNFTLEQWEMDQGFVLTCQSRAVTPRVVVSYDER